MDPNSQFLVILESYYGTMIQLQAQLKQLVEHISCSKRLLDIHKEAKCVESDPVTLGTARSESSE